MENKPLLFSYFKSSCSWRIRAALAYKGIEYDTKFVDLLRDGGYQHSEEYKKINPLEKVPALIIDGHTLHQSVSILEYLEETRPEPCLLPKDAVSRATVRTIVHAIVSDIQPNQKLPVLLYLNENQRPEWPRHWIAKGFDGLEKIISVTSGKYCFGNKITMADFCLVPQVYNAKRYGVDMSQFPLISKINDELNSLDCFKTSHPSLQPDCLDELKI